MSDTIREYFIVATEDPDIVYVCLPDIRLIYRRGAYMGWYRPDAEYPGK